MYLFYNNYQYKEEEIMNHIKYKLPNHMFNNLELNHDNFLQKYINYL